MEPNKLLRMVYEKSDEIDELWRTFLAVVKAGIVQGSVTQIHEKNNGELIVELILVYW